MGIEINNYLNKLWIIKKLPERTMGNSVNWTNKQIIYSKRPTYFQKIKNTVINHN